MTHKDINNRTYILKAKIQIIIECKKEGKN